MTEPAKIHRVDPVLLKQAFNEYYHALRHDWMRRWGGTCPECGESFR